MKVVQVQLEWKSKADEQLDKIKGHNKYSTVIRFLDDPSWPGTAWSVVLSSFAALQGDNTMKAEMQFLSEKGPEHFLAAGNKFELYEGPKCVSKGLVL